MATLVSHGDRLITSGGRESWLKRPSVPFAQYGGGSVALSMDGRVTSYQNIVDTQPWVAVVVNKLNRQISRLPLIPHRLLEGTRWHGESEPLEPDHALWQLLAHPYRRGSSMKLKQKAAWPALVHGNAVLAKFRPAVAAPPDALVPLDWRYLTPYALGGDGEVDFWETSQTGRPQRLSLDDVVHFAFESGNGCLGTSPLRQLGTTLRTEDSAQRYQASSFDNGARPAGALSLPAEQRLDEDERQELREEIRAQHGGVDNAFKIALLTGGMTWLPFSHSAVEAELIEQRKLNREEIAAVYDVPPPLIGILDHATYSNVAEMHRMLFTSVLGPWLSLIEDTLQAQLIDAEPAWEDEGLFVAFDLSEVLKGDALKEMQAIREGINTGVLMPSEGRSRLNLRKVDQEGVDKLYLPTNNLSAIDDPAATDSTDTQPVDDVVKAHVARAVQRLASKMGAGQDGWDRQRFVRELNFDAPDADVDAIADRLEEAVTAADSPEALRRLTNDLQ